MNKLKSNDYSNTKVEVHIKGKNIFLATSLNLVISIFQLFGGLFSNSLALLTDALHNFSDAINVTLYYLAEKINLRNAQETKTTNLKWIEFSASILKSIIMLSICCFLFFEAVQRFEHPQPVKGVLMVLIASISLVANVMAVKLLKKESQKSMHIKSAYLHLLTDTFSSLAIIIAGTMIFYFHIYWLDSIVTFLIGAYIFKEAFNAIVYAYHIANNSKSIQISMKEIKSSIEQFSEVNHVIQLNSWKKDNTEIHLECLIDLRNDMSISQTESLISRIKFLLQEQFRIRHTTIQFECNMFKNNIPVLG